jgi:hypothetical protein
MDTKVKDQRLAAIDYPLFIFTFEVSELIWYN